MAARIVHLKARAAIGIAGSETLAFLHDLVTADVADLKPGEAAHTGLLTPQGKVLFDFFILAQDGGALLDCEASQRDGLLQRLTMYKLRRPLEISARDDLAVAAMWGGEMPDMTADIQAYADPRREELGQRLIGPAETVRQLGSAPAQDYLAHRISLGIADGEELGSADLFPHEANYDLLGSVNFKKGCYIGQEVVSRMQHRSTARSRIVPVSGAQDLPQAGSAVLAGERQSGKLLVANGKNGLAIVRLDRASANDSSLSVDGAPVSYHTPPWAPDGAFTPTGKGEG